MSELQNKSEIFKTSAEELHGKNYFSPVAHCSYYSCYQLMKHIWLHRMKKTQIIEIVPNKVYSSDENYLTWESQMFDDFILKYQLENICFISDDDLVGLENIEKTLYGAEYVAFSTGKELRHSIV